MDENSFMNKSVKKQASLKVVWLEQFSRSFQSSLLDFTVKNILINLIFYE